MILSRVVLPLPDGPIIPTNSPCSIVKSISVKARWVMLPSYTLLTCFTFSMHYLGHRIELESEAGQGTVIRLIFSATQNLTAR